MSSLSLSPRGARRRYRMASTNLFRAVSRGPSNPPERPTPPPALSPLKISTFLKSTRVASYLRPLVSRTLSPGVRHTVTTWRRSELARPVSQLPSIPRQRLTPHRDTLEKDLYTDVFSNARSRQFPVRHVIWVCSSTPTGCCRRRLHRWALDHLRRSQNGHGSSRRASGSPSRCLEPPPGVNQT